MKNLTNMWGNLSARDRLALILGGSIVLIFIFYQFVYSSLTDTIAIKTNQLKEKKATVAWLHTINLEPKAGTAVPINKARLLSLIGSELRATPFKNFPVQVEQTGMGDIQITFDKIPYNQAMIWLWKLNKTYTIQIKQVNIDKTEAPGVVKFIFIITPLS